MDTVNVEKKKEKKRNKNWVLIPSIIALGFIPLLLHSFFYKNKLNDFIWFAQNQVESGDLFSGWKMIATFTVGVIMMGILAYRKIRYHETIKLENAFYPLAIYGFFVILSAIFSKYKYWVFCGMFCMLEPVGVVLAYIVICFYTYHYLENEKQVYTLLRWSGIGVALVLIDGFLQFLGFDFFLGTKLGRILVSNTSMWENVESGVPKNVVYATLFNQNYACIYFSVLVPVFIALAICCKKTFYRILALIAAVVSILCVYGARSAAGNIALIVSMSVAAFVLLSRTKKTMIPTCVVATLGMVAMILVCIFTPIGKKVSVGLLGTNTKYNVQSIDTTNGYVEMKINHQILRLTYGYDEKEEECSITCKDGDGNVLETEFVDDDSPTQVITNILYLRCNITPILVSGRLEVLISVDGHEWRFSKTEDGQYCYINPVEKDEVYKSPTLPRIFNNDAVSNRGRIWNGAFMSIMQNSYLLGVGANAFLFAFPQEDYITKEYINTPTTLDVKAHSLYLQQWIENGVLALCGFLLFFVGYLIQSIRIYRKADFHDGLTWIGFGLFTGILSYLIAGLANDSTVSTATPFWVMMGVGMAVNRIIEQKFAVPEPVDTENPVETTDTKEETDAC